MRFSTALTLISKCRAISLYFFFSILFIRNTSRCFSWEKNNIFPKPKDVSIAQLVSETILTLRCFLIDQKVNEIKQDTQNEVDHQSQIGSG